MLKPIQGISEQQAFELEIKLIQEIGRYDLQKGPLTNLTDGGGSSSGYRHPPHVLAKLKKNFERIKAEFQRRGYILETSEEDYKDCYTKLYYTCPKGHEHFVKWSDFQQGSGCPYCASQKITFASIKAEFERKGCILEIREEDYTNAHAKLLYICPWGVSTTLLGIISNTSRVVPVPRNLIIPMQNLLLNR